MRKEAGSLRKEIEQTFSVKPKMGLAMGELKVLVDGKQIFSYKDAGRMPNAGEIAGLIRADAKA